MKKNNINFGEALRYLAHKVGVNIPSTLEPGVQIKERERLFQANKAAAEYFHDNLLNSDAASKARGYVSSRDFLANTLTNFQLGL